MEDQSKTILEKYSGQAVTSLLVIFTSVVKFAESANALPWNLLAWIVFFACCFWCWHVFSATYISKFDPSSEKRPIFGKKERLFSVLVAVLSFLPAAYVIYENAGGTKKVRVENVEAIDLFPTGIGSKGNTSLKITVANHSEEQKVVSSVRIHLSRSSSSLVNIAGWNTYYLKGQIDAKGMVTGSADTQIPGVPEGVVQRPVEGWFRKKNAGGREVEFTVPVHVSVDKAGDSAIVVTFPDTLEVTSFSVLGMSPDLRSYSNERFNEFKLKELLRDGAWSAEITVCYGEKEKSSSRFSIEWK